MIGLGIDAGASSSRWLLLEDGQELARGRGPAITGHMFADGDRASTLERLTGLCADVLRHGAPDSVVAGITGLDPGGGPARELAAALAGGLGIPGDRVHVTHDMAVAYRSAFAPGQGVVVYAGTGSIAYHEPSEPTSEPLRVGGHGYLIDDAGGGFWIGRRALQSVLRERDRLGRRPTGSMAEQLYARIGSDRWEDVRAFVYGGGRTAVASLAPAVGAAAAAGDDDARTILHEAGAALARLARVMFERLGGQLPVALMGGIVNAGEPLLDGFASAAPQSVEWRAVPLEPVAAAARLATEPELEGGS